MNAHSVSTGSARAHTPGLLGAVATVAVAVDGHAAALEAALRRFGALEERLARVLERLGGHGVQVIITWS